MKVNGAGHDRGVCSWCVQSVLNLIIEECLIVFFEEFCETKVIYIDGLLQLNLNNLAVLFSEVWRCSYTFFKPLYR